MKILLFSILALCLTLVQGEEGLDNFSEKQLKVDAQFLDQIHSEDGLDKFIEEQLKIEAQFLDQNLSLDQKMAIQDKQEKLYQKFFFEYATEAEKYKEEVNPYYMVEKRLRLRLKNNKYKGNVNAVKRDEIRLKNYALRQDMRILLRSVLLETEGTSKNLYKTKVNKSVLAYFAKYKPLDKNKYKLTDKNETNRVLRSLNEAILSVNNLEGVANSFAVALVKNQLALYRTSRIANSKFFSILNTINKSPYSEDLNTYLKFIHLDVATILAVIILILFILITIRLIRFLINYLLHRYQLREVDIEYIHSQITSVFNVLAVFLILNVLIVAVMGVDTKSINISKIFGILYVVIISLLAYRVTNTIAYMKMEKIKQSKLLKNEVFNLSLKVLNGLIFLIAVTVSLKILDVDLTAILSGLGIAGAAIAFAAKDSIANIFASISILLGDVFAQGDWIETKDVNGTVVEIGLRASTLRTFDNALVSIPNSELSNTGVKNWSRRRIGRRIKMHLGVTYQSKFSDIEQAITDIREMLKDHPGIANQRSEYNNALRQSRLVSSEDFQGVKRTTLVYMDTFQTQALIF